MNKKVILLSVSVLLVVLISVVGTLAYLTDRTSVKNTFTVGNVDITLDETDVTPEGDPTGDGRKEEGNEYHLIPGLTYTKDPIVHVNAESEECWVFVKVENGISAIEDANHTIAVQMAANGWTPVAGETDVYAYEAIVAGGTDVAVFESFTIAGSTDGDALAACQDAEIVVTAYAIQAATFDNAADAWEALMVQMNA